MSPDFNKAAHSARKQGLVHLAELYASLDQPLVFSSEPTRSNPRICFVFNNKNWCDGKLSNELSSHLSEYACRLVDKTDLKHFSYQDDFYIFRNAVRGYSSIPVDWARSRVACILESARPFNFEWCLKSYSYTGIVVAQNRQLRDRAISMGIQRIHPEIIGNGINTVEFSPADRFPEEFTVGAAGNFSQIAFDEWKGFSRYIVPACRLANVKLKWCGWTGKTAGSPNSIGEQIPLDKMNDWYRGISCLVSMSKSEGCSGVVFEAMATGLPVISTRVGWHAENCIDEILWIDRPELATPEDDRKIIERLAGVLTELKNNSGFCNSLGKRAREFAEKWSHSRIADQWRPIIESFLNMRRS